MLSVVTGSTLPRSFNGCAENPAERKISQTDSARSGSLGASMSRRFENSLCSLEKASRRISSSPCWRLHEPGAARGVERDFPD